MRMNADKKRTWMEMDGKVYCYKSPDNLCHVSRLRSAKLSAFHDKALLKATEQINAILVDIEKSNKNKDRELSILNTGEGLLLAWVQCCGIGAGDSGAVKALNLSPVKKLRSTK